MKYRDPAAVSFVAASVICMGFLCMMLNNSTNYANVESGNENGVVSAFAENPEPLMSLGKMEFDDSVWGDLARAMQKGLSRWLG